MPETRRHLELRTLLFQLLLRELRAGACVGSQQFVYWDASNPRMCLAPDVFVRLGVPDAPFSTWKTWERGAPELAVEIVSDSDAPGERWEAKLDRYRALGVDELVRFDPEAPAGARLEVWDRIEGDLVERVVVASATPCRVLGLHWVVRPALGYEAALRLARDAGGAALLLSDAERLAELEASIARGGGAPSV